MKEMFLVSAREHSYQLDLKDVYSSHWSDLKDVYSSHTVALLSKVLV